MNRAAFYNTIRAKLGPLKGPQVAGFEHILDAIEGAPLSHQAYMLATAWHETGATMQPVKEAHYLGAKAEAWRKKNLRYWPHYGRGYVQITWLPNYEWLDAAAAKAGLTKPGEILANLDLAMRPDIAAFALRKGMEEGRYDTHGKTMAQRLPMSGTATRAQYINARYLVNVQDKADLVEDYAQAFERALRDGGVS
jgi:putative chitinase